MICPRCQHENGAAAKFCEQCASALARVCTNCGTQVSPIAKFCSHCGHSTGQSVVNYLSAHSQAVRPQTAQPIPENFLTSPAELAGERKQVSVLFADITGSLALISGQDPESAQAILNPVLEQMIEAVHRMMVRSIGSWVTVSWRFLARRSRMRIMPCALVTPR